MEFAKNLHSILHKMEFVLLLKMIMVMTLTSGQIHVTNMVPPWPDPYWDIPGNYCSAAYPKLRNCLNDILFLFYLYFRKIDRGNFELF